MVQPKGVRVIRQVIGPTPGGIQQPQQIYSPNGQPLIQAVPTTLMQ